MSLLTELCLLAHGEATKISALTGFEKSVFHPVFHLWLKIQTTFAPFVHPKLSLAGSLPPATLAHGLPRSADCPNPQRATRPPASKLSEPSPVIPPAASWDNPRSIPSPCQAGLVLGRFWIKAGISTTVDGPPRTKDVSPRTKDASLRTKDASLRTKDASLRTKDASPRTKDAPPRTMDAPSMVMDMTGFGMTMTDLTIF